MEIIKKWRINLKALRLNSIFKSFIQILNNDYMNTNIRSSPSQTKSLKNTYILREITCRTKIKLVKTGLGVSQRIVKFRML